MTNELKLSVQIERLGTVVEPDTNDPLEGLGMINPASLVLPDGRVLIYPRAVEKPNISRMARLQLTKTTDPCPATFLQALRQRADDLRSAKLSTACPQQYGNNGLLAVKRLGYGLVPQAAYEFRQAGGEFGAPVMALKILA